MTTENDEQRAIEAVWRNILQRNGVSEARADNFVKLTFGTPALKQDIPDIEDVPDIVEDSLDNLELDAHLDDDVDPVHVRDELMHELEDALRGEYRGPVAVSDATLAQPYPGATPPPEPGTNDAIASPAASTLQPDRGRAYQTRDPAESNLSEEDIDDLAGVLEIILDDQDLEVVDLYAALDHLEGRRSE